MSYHPSHRKPPRQERWPNATPQEGWPAYAGGDGYRDGEAAWGTAGESAGAGSGSGATGGYGEAWTGYPRTGNGYAATDDYGDPRGGYPGAGNGYAGTAGGYPGTYDGYAGVPGGYPGAADGFTGAADGFDGAPDGHPWAAYDSAPDGHRADGFDGAPDGHPWAAYDGTGGGYGDTGNGHDGYGAARADYDDAWNGYRGQDGYPGDRDVFGGPAGYLETDGYDPDGYAGADLPSSRPGPPLMAPDDIGEPRRRPSRGERQEPGSSGLIAGALTGLLAAAVAIGVATLASAFVRPQASPVIAVGGAFIDRTPPALKNFAVEHFGENDKTVLLLGMYVTIALIAIAIGCLARRTVTIGVAGIAAFGLFGAFVAVTRPDGRVSDVIPSVIGGIAGIAALLWLAHSSAPVPSLRHAYDGGRRRA